MITLIRDEAGLYSTTPADLVFERDDQYIEVRQRIYQALHAYGGNLTVVVRGGTAVRHWHWLRDLFEYGSQWVRQEEFVPRRFVEEKYRIKLPAALTNSMLTALLQRELPPPDASDLADPEGWMLSGMIDPLWRIQMPDAAHLMQLIRWAVKSPDVPTEWMPLLGERLKAYSERSDSPEYGLFTLHSPATAALMLFRRWALRRYPAEVRANLGLENVPLLTFEAQDALLIRDVLAADTPTTTALRAFWQTWSNIQSGAPYTEAMALMSGLFSIEARVVAGLVRKAGALDEDGYAAVLHLFRDAGEEVNESLLALREHIVMPEPDPGDTTEWSTYDWLTWAKERYLPYFVWTIRTRRPRTAQMRYGNLFAEWYFNAYQSVFFDENAFITGQRRHIHTSGTGATLWLIVDSLSWWESELLRDLLAAKSIGVPEHRPYLAPLPSLTAISKPALVAGFLSAGQYSTRRVLESYFAERGDSDFSLFTQVSEMRDHIREAGVQPGLYVLLDTKLDAYHHMATGIEDKTVEGFLSQLVELVTHFFRASRKQGISASAFVSSDHGVTLLPKEAQPLKLPRSASQTADDDLMATSARPDDRRRTRVAEVNSLPNDAGAEWFVLRKDSFELPSHYLIPRDYVSVGGRIDKWTHGGATPEEVVVPFMRLAPSPTHVLASHVRFHYASEGLRLNTTNEIRVEIINPNELALSEVRLTFGSDQSERFSDIAAESTVSKAIALNVGDVESADYLLSWQLSALADGRTHTIEGSEKFKLRRFMTAQDDFTDLFSDE